jgi:hypothetical protein
LDAAGLIESTRSAGTLVRPGSFLFDEPLNRAVVTFLDTLVAHPVCLDDMTAAITAAWN